MKKNEIENERNQRDEKYIQGNNTEKKLNQKDVAKRLEN